MATTKIMSLHAGKNRSAGTAIRTVIDYVKNPEKTAEGRLITSYQCNSQIADAEFQFSKEQYLRRTERARGADDVIAYHMRQSFVPGEITPEEANRLGCELAKRFTKGNHAYIVCTHIDRHHIHNHIIWNSTDLTCDCKFRNFWGSAKAVRRLNDMICIENGYSIVENPKGRGKSYDKWLGEKKPTQRARIRRAIDDALEQKPKDFDAFLELLRQAGYEIKGTANPSLRGNGQKRFARMDTLGEGYTADELRAVIGGKAKHRQPTTAAGSLIVDIQAKLKAGKGARYEQWAKRFNLKQIARSVAYLQEHGVTSYEELADKADAAAKRYRELSDKIKSAEIRMAELSVMRTHIINYSKTCDTYIAYRKVGYSQKFLAEHEADILLHKAAKTYFDEQKLTKLPTVKELQSEYAALLNEKKAAYSDYRSARDEMRDLATAKANVDSLMEYSVPERDRKTHVI